MSNPQDSVKSFGQSHLSCGTGFVQVKMKWLDHWEELIAVSPAAARIWIWLVKWSDRLNQVHVEDGSITAALGISRATLYRSYALLEERSWIMRDGGMIHLNASIVWRGVKPGTQRFAKLNCPPTIPLRDDLPASFNGVL